MFRDGLEIIWQIVIWGGNSCSWDDGGWLGVWGMVSGLMGWQIGTVIWGGNSCSAGWLRGRGKG